MKSTRQVATAFEVGLPEDSAKDVKLSARTQRSRGERMSVIADQEKIYQRSQRMVGRRIAGEYILVPIVGRGADVEAIYNLNEVGAFIWEQFDGKTTGDQVVRAIADRYEVDLCVAERDYRQFLEQLMTIQAVLPGDTSQKESQP